MNRRILVAIAFSFLTVWVFQYFTQRNNGAPQAGSGEVQSGAFYSSPVKQVWHKEPQREIDFVDVAVQPKQEKIFVAETPLYKARFSSFGGVVQSLSFKKHRGKESRMLQTIGSDTVDEREEGAFLVALNEKSPYIYNFVSQERSEGTQKVVYEAKADGWLVRKTYLLHDNIYRIDLTLDFIPARKDVQAISPRLFFPAPMMLEAAVRDGEGEGLLQNYWNPAVAGEMTGVLSRNGVSVETVSKRQELGGVWGLPEIFGGADKYFAHVLVKDSKHFTQGGYYKRVNKKLFSILEGPEFTEKKSWTLSFYVGPKLLNSLSAVDPRLEDLLSFGWLSWFCKLLLKLLEFLYKHLGNFGLAIIVLTILLKLPFLPLSISSRRKMEEYQKYQPTIQRIRAKYKSNLQLQQAEILRFHKEHNLSPATPMIGCLPLLIQLPILFSLYRVLGNYLSLYQAPFFGWIHDLSAKDPYYILPILMGLTMIVQQRMSPAASDEKQRMIMMFMPIVMTAVFVNFPAGLVLYWFMNNLLGVLEDVLRRKVFS